MEYKEGRATDKAIKIAQINAQNSRLALQEIRTTLKDHSIDAIAIQEPYNWRREVSGLGITTRVIADAKPFTNRTECNGIKSAIAVPNPNIRTLKLKHICNTHFACAEIATTTIRLYLVSAYMQFSEPISHFIRHLETIIDTLKGQDIIMCIDANATSALWHNLKPAHGRSTERRGDELEDFIAQHRLVVLNRTGNAPTFDNIHGQSNIDVTIATSNAAKKIKNWKVHPHLINSDHSLITFEIENTGFNRRIEKQAITRYNTKRANWELYRKNISLLVQKNQPTSERMVLSAQNYSERIDNIILQAADKAIPKKTKYSKSVPWWNKNLSKLRKNVFDARHRIQRTKDNSARERLLTTYRKIRNTYTTAVRQSKQASWENFVNKEGNRTPWSLIYRLQTKRLNVEQAQSCITNENKHTTTWEETAKALLDTLIPDDNSENEDAWHRKKREFIKEAQGTCDAPPFTTEEISQIVNNLNVNKAPGHDLIEARMIKEAWPSIHNEICTLINHCLEQQTFPDQYKVALIRVILKSDDKDETDAKSYRPISLLPVMGKILEKAIAGRVKTIVNDHPRSSRRQYGFRPGRSTEDAIVEVQRLVKASQHRYVVGMLFDISGAFDNVWWPSILSNLKDRGCPKNIYGLIKSYLSNRRAKISGVSEEVEKTVTKGCPQGSVLGPLFWNLVFDEAIEIAGQNGEEPIAFADDLIVLVSGNSRNEIEIKGNKITQALSDWSKKQKLELSRKKSEMILLKGFLDIKRPPTIKIEDTSLKMKNKVRYLGVHFGTRLNITPHIEHITAKARNLFAGLTKLAREHWGLTTKTIRTIYKGLYLPILCYAAAGWAENLRAHHIKKLRSAQRQPLLAITRAYRTTATDALTILAAEPPIHIVIKERIATYKLRKGIAFSFGNIDYNPETEQQREGRSHQIKHRIQEEVTKQWQTEWDNSEHGKKTRAFFPKIASRYMLKDTEINHHTMQLLSGHGHIRNTLHKHKLSETNLCRCGETDTTEHIIYDCANETTERVQLIAEIRNAGHEWPCTQDKLVHRQIFKHFKKYAEDVMRKREQTEHGHRLSR